MRSNGTPVETSLRSEQSRNVGCECVNVFVCVKRETERGLDHSPSATPSQQSEVCTMRETNSV